jgi:hypothetical protein
MYVDGVTGCILGKRVSVYLMYAVLIVEADLDLSLRLP